MTHGLDALLWPRSVAIVGASDNPAKVGGRPLRHLLAHGYRGELLPVTPHVRHVQDVPAYPRLQDLRQAPDAVVLAVPAQAAESEIEACARIGVRGVVLFSSGYAEAGNAGRAAQNRLATRCAAAGIRLLGPNTIGCANFSNGAVLSFASVYLEVGAQDGPVAIVSQSGAFGVSAYALLREQGIGVRYVCTTGNQADLDVADCLAAVSADPAVRVVLMYLEDTRRADALRRALETARQRNVAVLAVPAGASIEGARSAALHTGSNGVGDSAIESLFDATACSLVPGLPELCESVRLYLRGASGPDGLVLIGNSGASGVLAADAAERCGLRLARLGEASRAALDAVLPPFSLNRNPIDLTAMLLSDPSLLGRVMDIVLADSAANVAVLGLLAIGGPSYDLPRFVGDCAAASARSGKAVVIHAADRRVREAFAQGGFAVYPSEHAAIAAVARWVGPTAGARETVT